MHGRELEVHSAGPVEGAVVEGLEAPPVREADRIQAEFEVVDKERRSVLRFELTQKRAK